MSKKMIILELNEVPPKVFQTFIKKYPKSKLTQLCNEGHFIKTIANDIIEDKLYPSQTWASLNTGLPFSRHKVYWYNDPKNEIKFYWQELLDKQTIGLVGTLHSSPGELIKHKNLKFHIPDCFATTPYTFPEKYKDFQEFNLYSVNRSGRKSNSLLNTADLLKAIKLLRHGFSFETYSEIIKILADIKVNKRNERLRHIQFLLMSDIFLKLIKNYTVDISVLFTNHVAAQMHRYWYATYPEDYSEKLYSHEWVDKFSDEIMYSMRLFDRFLEKLLKDFDKETQTLIIVTSMGQMANDRLTTKKTSKKKDAFFDKPELFFKALFEGKYDYEFMPGMVPQGSCRFSKKENIEEINKYIKSVSFEGIKFSIDWCENIATFSLSAEPRDKYYINDNFYSSKDLGIIETKIEDHHSGKHSKEGALVIYGKNPSKIPSEIDYTDYTKYLFKIAG